MNPNRFLCLRQNVQRWSAEEANCQLRKVKCQLKNTMNAVACMVAAENSRERVCEVGEGICFER